MSLVQTCLVEVLIRQHPRDESILRQCENIDDLLDYTKEHLSNDDIEIMQSVFVHCLDEAHADQNNQIETAEFDISTPLPVFDDLEDPQPYEVSEPGNNKFTEIPNKWLSSSSNAITFKDPELVTTLPQSGRLDGC